MGQSCFTLWVDCSSMTTNVKTTSLRHQAIEEKFGIQDKSKNAKAKKGGGNVDEDEKPKVKKEPELKVIQVITDANQVLQMTSALQQCPPPADSALVLQELDDEALDADCVGTLRQFAVPDNM